MSNPFLTKKDPLLEAVQSAMQDGEIRRKAEALVNEEFGVYSRKAVVREDLAAYDARLEEAYKCMKEGEQIDEIRDRPKKDDINRRKRDAVAMKLGHDNPEGRNNNYNAPVSMLKHGRKLMKQGVTKEEKADKDYDKDGKIESPKDEVWGSRFRAAKMAGKMEEEQIDELYGKGKLPDIRRKHSDDYQTHKARANFHHGEADKADEKDDDEKFERHYGKAVGHERSAEKSAAKRGRASALMDRAKASSDLKAAKNKAKEYRKLAKEEIQIDELKKPTAKTAMQAYRRAETHDDMDGNWNRSNRLYRWKEKNLPGKSARNQKPTGKAKLPDVSNTDFHKDGYSGHFTKKGKLTKSATKDTKADIKSRLGKHTKPNLPEGYELDEAAYSAKAARAGKDIGKPGKMFSKIASKAGEKYGSEERGKKVAGAILKRIRAKHMKEDSSF